VNPTRLSLPVLLGVGALVAAVVTALAVRVVLGQPGELAAATVDPSEQALGQGVVQTQSEAGFAVWADTLDGGPLRWDPCRPLELVLALQGAPDGAEDEVREAAERLSAASGVPLRVIGTTEERPAGDRALVVRDGAGWRWNPVLVAWATPAEAEAARISLTPADRGVALPVAVRAAGREGYVTGQVVLNAARTDLVPGFGDRANAWGATLLHELAHLLGLAHVDLPGELMSVDPGRGPVAFGPGDLAGLAHVGAAGGCLTLPDPSAGRILDRPGTTPP
jgi:hypothetical protein